ncbi:MULTISPECIES: branched-chain amino acid ABC transporter permease [unclassified Cryobacterium]|uniref:branched-chain amino acid ABC transporter permease n=1 Tax=unclassified Cryobacterium TaxID=2649013 RepID=UPI00106D9AD7|nr:MULTISPECIES: branched-chain amino acid ABC transporter permease [unclassified Cryobacterium]TFD02973.1 branched-chain amino acid ABC transporter permease [Cryobacterium sp. TMT1-66-1]TFD15342.1 branched-chain amino acid ABC transporter permease [Cryobacterium sp. TMT1-2-2]
MEILAQTVLTGLLLGGVYGLIAMGLSLVFGVMRIINFAHGNIVLLGMYTVLMLYTTLGINPFLALLIVVPVGLLLGAVLQSVLFARLRDAGELPQLLLTLGLGIIIQSIVQVVFSPGQRSLTGFAWGSELVDIGGIYLRPAHVVGFVIAIAITIGLTFILKRTDFGRQMRATVDDAEIAESSGVRSKRIYIIAVGIGTSIALVAGGVLVTYQPASPTLGNEFLVLAFVAVVLGGLGNIMGAFIGGLIAGTVQQLTAAFVSVGLQDVGLFTLFILVLIFRPNGLFGRKEITA